MTRMIPFRISGSIATALLLCVLCVCDARAQTRTLTLEETLRLADEQSIDVRKARLAVERSSLTIEGARTAYLPEVTASGDVNINLQRQVLFIAPGNPFNETGTTQAFPIGSRYTAGLAVNVIQPLYNPLRRAQIEIAESGRELTEAQLEVARAIVRLNAERAFYRALYARNNSLVRDEQVKVAERNLDLAVIRFRAGRAMPLDTLTASASVVRSEAEAQKAGFEYSKAKLVLARILDIPNYDSIEVVGELDIPAAPGPSGGDMTLTGLLNSAELRLADEQRQAAVVNARLASATLYPTVDAVGRWQSLGQSNSLDPAESRWAMTSFVGVSAFYPIFNIWRGAPEREEAQIRVREAELEIERVREVDSVQFETLLLTTRAARAQLQAERASIEQAKKAEEIATILYKEGRATLFDVEQAQSRVLEARLAEDRAKLEFLDAYAELKAISGEGATE